MAPLQPSASPQKSRNNRRGLQQQQEAGGGIGGWKKSGIHNPAAPERSSSFHVRSITSVDLQRQTMMMRRPKTQPDLLSRGGRKLTVASPSSSGRKVPSKVLLNVNVQRSLGAVQVMASTDWTVHQLVAASLKQYLKEGRRPLLPSTDPSAFGLHYSQFSFECLDPNEKLMDLGPRNFFLCPKDTTTIISVSVSPTTTATASDANNTATPALSLLSSSSSSCSKEADKAASKITIPCLRFMDFLF